MKRDKKTIEEKILTNKRYVISIMHNISDVRYIPIIFDTREDAMDFIRKRIYDLRETFLFEITIEENI